MHCIIRKATPQSGWLKNGVTANMIAPYNECHWLQIVQLLSLVAVTIVTKSNLQGSSLAYCNTYNTDIAATLHRIVPMYKLAAGVVDGRHSTVVLLLVSSSRQITQQYEQHASSLHPAERICPCMEESNTSLLADTYTIKRSSFHQPTVHSISVELMIWLVPASGCDTCSGTTMAAGHLQQQSIVLYCMLSCHSYCPKTWTHGWLLLLRLLVLLLLLSPVLFPQ
jgi:hypothetical protein